MNDRQLLSQVHAPCEKKKYGIECYQGVNVFHLASDIFQQNMLICDAGGEKIRVEAGYDIDCHKATVHLLQYVLYESKMHSHVHVYREGDILRIKKIEIEELLDNTKHITDQVLDPNPESPFSRVFNNKLTKEEKKMIDEDFSFTIKGVKYNG